MNWVVDSGSVCTVYVCHEIDISGTGTMAICVNSLFYYIRALQWQDS